MTKEEKEIIADLISASEQATEIILGEYPESQWEEKGVPKLLEYIKKAKVLISQP